jgi:hypothetical protein
MNELEAGTGIDAEDKCMGVTHSGPKQWKEMGFDSIEASAH